MFRMRKRKWRKRGVSLLLSVLLGVSAMLPQTVMAEEAAAETAVNSSGQTEKKSFQKGKILLSLSDHDGEKVVMDVLYREADGMVWVNGEVFESYFPEYEYTYTPYSDEEDSQGYVQIRAYSRHYAFRTGSAVSMYKTYEVENFYTLQEKVIAYDGKAWIPAEDFFYYLCCSTAAVHAEDSTAASDGNSAEEMSAGEDTDTGQEAEWVPLQDFLMVSDPQYTMIDILYDIYTNDFGLYWMFDYERDFGMTQDQMNTVLTAADLALSLYGVATLDWETVLYTATKPITELKNEFSKLKSAILGEEETEVSRGLFQDDTYAELFINAMANSGAEQVELVTEISEETLDVSQNILSESLKEVYTAVKADRQELQQLLYLTGDDPNLRGIFYKNVKDLSTNMTQLQMKLEETQAWADVGDAALNAFEIVLDAVSVCQEIQNMDGIMTDAMEKYLEYARNDTELDTSMFEAFSRQISQWGAGEGVYFVTETLSKSVESILDNVAQGLSPTGFAAAIADLSWSLFENSALYPEELLARSDEPKSLKLSLYGRQYEYDAWQILTNYYVDYVYANGFWMESQIEDCAYLALNYLKSCYVTTEAALDALVGSEIKEDLTYQKVEDKCTELTEMMVALEEDISCLDTGRESGEESLQTIALGVPFQQLTTSNEMTEELFLHDEYREEGQSYSYSSPSLNADEMQIAPLVAYVDYYAFLRNELLPARGLCSLETASHVIVNGSDPWNTDGGWDSRSGLLGADVADLNADGSDDLLVYLMEEDAENSQLENHASVGNIVAEVYTVTAEGKIERITRTTLESVGYDVSYDRVNIGLMEKGGRTFLYVELDGISYYLNGGTVSYTWYGLDEDGVLRPWWMVGHTDGGSSGLACSLLVYSDAENYSKYVLWADEDFRYCYPEVEVYEDEDYGYAAENALRAGFSMLDLPTAGVYATSENGYFADDGRLPTYWGTEWMKESVSYLCTGEDSEEIYGEDGSYQGIRRNMQVSLEDRSGLREKLEEIGYEAQAGDYWSDGSVVAVVDTAGQAYSADGTALTPISG